jgi:ABC-type amino acid transport substrate-binding protein
MKLITTIIITALISFGVAYGTVHMASPQSSSKTETKKETAYDRVMRTRTIQCGYAVWPPIVAKDVNTGKMSGIVPDVMEAIGKELELKIEWKEEVGWGNFIEGLKTGRYDMMCATVWPDPDRTKFLSMTTPVLYAPVYAVVRKDDTRFDGNLDKVNDPGVTVAAIDGDITKKISDLYYPKAKILALPQAAQSADVMVSVMTKKADVTFIDEGMLRLFLKTNPDSLKIVDNVPPARIYPSVLTTDVEEKRLRDMLDVALQGLINNGEVDKIIQKYSDVYLLPKKTFQTKK